MENSQLRVQLNAWLERYALQMNLQNNNILEIGIAGDDKPSGSYKFFGPGNKWTTMDINPKWSPDIVGDITNCQEIKDNTYDLVIMTQAIEHIWEYQKAIDSLYRITKRYLILDCPWMFPYHQDAARRNVKKIEYDDYWRFSPAAMYKLLKNAGFSKVEVGFADELVLCLAEK